MFNLFNFELKQFFFHKSFVSSIFLSTIVTFISISLMHKNIEIKMLPSLLILIPILALSNKVEQIFQDDYKSGNLEFILVTHEPAIIVVVKMLCVFIVSLFTVFLNAFCAYMFFHLDFILIERVIIASIPVLLLASVMVCMIGMMRVYFDKNSNILPALIFPFIIPVLILYGIFFENYNHAYLYLSLGIGLIFIPLSIYLLTLLLKELYHN